MSEFEKFSIQKNINECENRLKKIEQTKSKILKYDEQIYATNRLQAVNSCAMFIVDIKHTSQYTIRLGSNKQSLDNPQYYIKTKTPSIIQILDNRIKQCQSRLIKWKNLLATTKNKKQQQSQIFMKNDGKFASKQVIGQNQEGQEIFNIVEFSQKPIEFKSDLPIINQNQQNQQSPFQEFPPQPIDLQQLQQNTNELQIIEEQQKQQQKPKKISKFKQQRMKMNKN